MKPETFISSFITGFTVFLYLAPAASGQHSPYADAVLGGAAVMFGLVTLASALAPRMRTEGE
jgi:hypothetical protein